MWCFRRIFPQELLEKEKFISFVGGGGKTTFIEYLASLFYERKKRVAIATTTKIYAKRPFVLFEDIRGEMEFVRTGKDIKNGKLTGLTFDEIQTLGRVFDVVLIEADGAKGKPLKCPKEDEPVIPPFSNRIFVLAGLDALEGNIKDMVFRWEIFCEKTGLKENGLIDASVFKLFFQKHILLKNVDSKKAIIVLNKYDSLRKREGILELGKKIMEISGINVLISSIFYKIFYMIKKA